jgi:hypothetical protein
VSSPVPRKVQHRCPETYVGEETPTGSRQCKEYQNKEMNILYQWKDQLKISRYTTFDHIWPDTHSMNNKLSNIGKMTIKCTALGDV